MKTDPIKRHVRLRDLDTLLEVVQSGGMRKAALHLHLSQPAVSKAVRSLEDTLGVTLLERGKRGVEPTKKGWIVGESMRIYVDDQGGYTLCFLRGTEEKTKKTYREKLDQARIAYKAGPDFSN